MYKTLDIRSETVWQWTIYGRRRPDGPALDAARAKWKIAFEVTGVAESAVPRPKKKPPCEAATLRELTTLHGLGIPG